MRLLKSMLLASTLLSVSAYNAQADVNVVASIKPVHSLVAAVMDGVGSPGLIVDGAGSPHTYALKPSQARELQNADVVFWIGHEMEAFLEKPLEAIATKAKAVELIDSHDLIKLKFREGGAFDEHDHDDHEDHKEHDDHDDHKMDAKKDHDHDHEKKAKKDHDHDHDDDHGKKAKSHEDHDDHDDHDHEKKAKKGHDHDHEKEDVAKSHDDHEDHDDHKHGAFDAHVWLDPVNAKALVHEIEETLVEADPANAAKYKANADALNAKLDTLIAEVTNDLESVKDKGFVVFHDAYQYFEKRFGLKASGSITVSPEVIPGAERIKEIRAKVQELGAVCVFLEPQFEPKLVATVIENTKAQSGVIDPLGAQIPDGPDLYFSLIRGMATSVKTCLTEAS